MSSSYPGTLDTFATNHADGTSEVIHAATINDLADAVNKVEAELGTSPSGASTTVKARLDSVGLGIIAAVELGADGAEIDTGTIDLTGIPILRVFGEFRETGSGDGAGNVGHAFMQINNDTTIGHYAWSVSNTDSTEAHSSAASGTGNDRANAIMVSHTAAQDCPSGMFGQTFLQFGYPGETGKFKAVNMSWNFVDNIGAPQLTLGTHGAGYWAGTGAITRLKFIAGSGDNFLAGSRILLLAP